MRTGTTAKPTDLPESVEEKKLSKAAAEPLLNEALKHLSQGTRAAPFLARASCR